MWNSVDCAFVVPPGTVTEDVARRLFRDAVPGKHPPQFDEAQRREVDEKHVRNWLDTQTTMVLYRGIPEFAGDPIVYVTLVPYDDGGELQLPIEAPPGGRVLGLAFSPSSFGPKSPPEARAFVVDRFVAAFDVLRPAWGYADASKRMGFEGKPPAARHWLEFHGPEREADARAAEKEGARVERRPWGGFVVRRWDDPFKPVEGRARGR